MSYFKLPFKLLLAMEHRALKTKGLSHFLTNTLPNFVHVSHAKQLVAEQAVTTEKHDLQDKKKSFPNA